MIDFQTEVGSLPVLIHHRFCYIHPQQVQNKRHLPLLKIKFLATSKRLLTFFTMLTSSQVSMGTIYHCCVFRPANRCSACGSLVEIHFLMIKQLFPSLTEQNKQKITKRRTKSCKRLYSFIVSILHIWL